MADRNRLRSAQSCTRFGFLVSLLALSGSRCASQAWDPESLSGATRANLHHPEGGASARSTDAAQPSVPNTEIEIHAGERSPGATFGSAVANWLDLAVVGAENHDLEGAAYAIRWDGKTFIREARLTPTDPAFGQWFGHSVSLSDDRILVGAYGDGEAGYNSGAAYVFRREAADWVQEAKLRVAGSQWDEFGWSVDLRADVAIVGAKSEDDLGAAYVFRWNGLEWAEEARLTASDGTEDDYFGSSVSLDEAGTRALIGAANSGGTGGAYVFEWNGTDWIESAKIVDSVEDGSFGWSVSLSEDAALIGAPGEGATYVFRKSVTGWQREALLIAPGTSVSLDGDFALSGAPLEPEPFFRGAAYLFLHDAGNWRLIRRIVPGDSRNQDRFGASVSIFGKELIIGSFSDSDFGLAAGAAYVYTEVSEPPTRVIDFDFAWSDGTSGLGTFDLWNDLSFTDDWGRTGHWRISAELSLLEVNYDEGQNCTATFRGRVSPPDRVEGNMVCRDGSGTVGIWSGVAR